MGDNNGTEFKCSYEMEWGLLMGVMRDKLKVDNRLKYARIFGLRMVNSSV